MAAARPCPHDLIRHLADATWKNPLHIRSARPATRPGGPCYLKQACVRIITDLRMNSTDLCTHRKNGENKAHMAGHRFRHGRWYMGWPRLPRRTALAWLPARGRATRRLCGTCADAALPNTFPHGSDFNLTTNTN